MGSVPSAAVYGKWTAWMSADELTQFLEEGDLVEFERDVYKHWGVFVQGNIKTQEYLIVHLAGEASEEFFNSSASNTSSPLSFSGIASNTSGGTPAAVVQSTELREVANGRRCRINNFRDNEFLPYPKDVIVARAVGEVGKAKYNVLLTNCEHFATWCRYGTKHSRQSSVVKSVGTAIVVGAITGSALFGVAGAATYFMGSQIAHRAWNRFCRDRVGW